MSRKQGLKWRVSWDDPQGTRVNVEDAGDFDEIVLDQWLHLERMNNRDWWMRLGDAYVWIHIDANGKAAVSVRRGEYENANGMTEFVSPDGAHIVCDHAQKTKPKRRKKR